MNLYFSPWLSSLLHVLSFPDSLFYLRLLHLDLHIHPFISDCSTLTCRFTPSISDCSTLTCRFTPSISDYSTFDSSTSTCKFIPFISYCSTSAFGQSIIKILSHIITITPKAPLAQGAAQSTNILLESFLITLVEEFFHLVS